jgi:hypothetical protein
MDGLRKTTRNLSQDIWPLGKDSNEGHKILGLTGIIQGD